MTIPNGPNFLLRTTVVAWWLGGFVALPADAAWEPRGNEVRATTASIPALAAAPDHAFGVFVSWQESGTDGTGPLRAQHLLADGSRDPAWPADGIDVCAFASARTHIESFSDGAGGAFVAWLEGGLIFLQRVTASGTIAAGWPARGLGVGSTTHAARVQIVPDGAGGVWATWNTQPILGLPAAVARRIGPNGTNVPGWSGGARVLSVTGDVPTAALAPRVAVRADGGAYVAWAEWSSDPTVLPSRFRLQSLSPTGSVLWELGGRDAGTLQPTITLGVATNADGFVGLAIDPASDLLLLARAMPIDNLVAELNLGKFDTQGAPAAGWPVTGVVLSQGVAYGASEDRDQFPHVVTSPLGHVYLRWRELALHTPPLIMLTRYNPGEPLPTRSFGASSVGDHTYHGSNLVVEPDGGAWTASVVPCGPYGMYDPYAFLGIRHTEPPSGNFTTRWSEVHLEVAACWYGPAIAVAPTGDGGAFLVWSELQPRVGVFARRVHAARNTTGVPTPGSGGRLELASTFQPGVPASVDCSFGAGGEARVAVFDAAGRVVHEDVLMPSAASRVRWRLPGQLPAGVYGVRVRQGAAFAAARVIVVR